MARLPWRRGLKFYGVGAIGIPVQLAALWLLAGPLHIHYLPATALAVETALLHNYLWHERFTWSDRRSVSHREALGRFLRFNFSSGALSIGGNLLLTQPLVAYAHLHYLLANLLAIAGCSLLNFLISDRLVFTRR